MLNASGRPSRRRSPSNSRQAGGVRGGRGSPPARAIGTRNLPIAAAARLALHAPRGRARGPAAGRATARRAGATFRDVRAGHPGWRSGVLARIRHGRPGDDAVIASACVMAWKRDASRRDTASRDACNFFFTIVGTIGKIRTTTRE